MSWSERAGKIFCFLCLFGGIYLIIKYAVGIFLPFIIAWGLAILIKPLAEKVSVAMRLPRKLCSAFLTILLIGAVGGILYLAVNRLIYESERFFIRISEDSDLIGDAIGAFFDKVSSIGKGKSPILESLLKIEQFREFWENVDDVIANVITSAVSSITSSIPMALLGFIGKLPSFLIFLLITLISCFYFTADIDKINSKVVSFFPKRIQSKIPDIKKHLLLKVSGYLRAYFILLLLTFGELLVGFSVLRVSYPLLLAVIVSILDILPLLGVGTVLIPWALIEILFMKDYYLGIGLFIIYVIITIVRQITEPKVVAGSLGLHPLVTLIAMYVGLRIFGFFGIIIGPFFLLIIKSIKDFSGGESVDIKGDV